MITRYASTEPVALAWLASVPGIDPDMLDRQDNQLPTDNASWAAKGFYTVTVIGGDTAAGYRFDEPVVQFQSWACTLDSPFPPWTKARHLIENVRVATATIRPQRVELGDYYDEAAGIKSVHALGPPRRSYGDFGDYASFVLDVQLHWVPAPQ